jgi:hypothetical protein
VTAATASSGTAEPIGQICTLALSCADQHHVDHIGGTVRILSDLLHHPA